MTHGLVWGTEVLGFMGSVGLSLQLGFHLSGGGEMGQQNEGQYSSAVLLGCPVRRQLESQDEQMAV